MSLRHKLQITTSALVFLNSISLISNALPLSPIDLEASKSLFYNGSPSFEAKIDLITPLRGSINSEVRLQQKQMENIINIIAGDILLKEGIKVIVTINNDSDPLVTTFKYDEDKENSWKSKHNGASWPVWGWLGLKPNQEFYNINVSVGMLRLVSSSAELAFLMGKEIAAIREGHIGEYVKDLTAKQRRSSIADQKAVELMVGKFDLDGALRIVSKLTSRLKNDKKTTNQAYRSFIEENAHEGVRIGTMQAYIEYLRRTRKDSQSLYLDNNIKPYKAFESGVNASKPLRGEFTQRLNEHKNFYRDQFILKFNSEFIIPNDQKSIKNEFGYSAPTKTEFEENMPWFLQELSQVPHLSGQERMDRLLSWYSFFEKSNHEDYLEMIPENRIAIYRFMILQLRDQKPWQIKMTLQRFEKISNPGYELTAANYVNDFFSSNPTQILMEYLAKLSSAHAENIAQALQESNSGKTADVDLRRFRYLLSSINDSETTPYKVWKSKLATNAFSFLKSDIFNIKFNKASDNIDSDYFNSASEIYKTLKNSKISEEQKQFLLKLISEFPEKRITVLKKIASNGMTSKDSFLLVKALSDDLPALTQEEINKLAPEIAKIAHHEIFDVPEKVGKFGIGKSIDSNVLEFYSSALESDSISLEEKFIIVKYLASTQNSKTDLPTAEAKDKSLRERLVNFVSSLSTEQALEIAYMKMPGHDNMLNSIYTDPNLYDLKSNYEERKALLEKELSQMQKENKTGTPEFMTHMFSMMDNLEEYENVSGKRDATISESARLNGLYSFLTFMGSDQDSLTKFSQNISLPQLKLILQKLGVAYQESLRPNSIWSNGRKTQHEPKYLSPSAGHLMLESFLLKGKDLPMAEWSQMFTTIHRMAKSSLDMRPGLRESFQKTFIDKVSLESLAKRFDYLNQKSFKSLVSAKQLSELLTPYLDAVIKTVKTDTAKGQAIDHVLKKMNLALDSPDSYNEIRSQVAVHLNLQPSQIDLYFPASTSSWSEQTKAFSVEVRGLSTLVALTRPRSVQEQIDTIDYFMGKRSDYPDFLKQSAATLDQGLPVSSIIRRIKERMETADIGERTFMVNTFLAGPSSIINKPEGLDQVLNILLAPVKKENREMAFKLARAQLIADGESGSLSIAYVMAQKPSKSGELSEGNLMKAVFEARGVPGVKLGQYMAFSSELAGFSEVLSELQDTALPLTYFEVLQLIQSRFNGQWPRHLKIKSVMGSGSVNVAIEYLDENNLKKAEVVSILRQDIEVKTAEDFSRLQKVVAELNRTPADQKTFGYLKGLLNIIRQSVELEFNKKNALEVQQGVKNFYDRQSGKWKIQTLEAYNQEHGAFFMEKGSGKTARKIALRSPPVYRDAMARLAAIEIEGLFGLTEKGNVRPVPFIANPDFHDGQVLIDEDLKKIIILDFGQALPITNQERDIAIEILRIITKAEKAETAVKIIKSISGKALITKAEMEVLFQRKERMDIFIQLISMLNQKGYQVPLTSVHWILGLNRQILLGDRIGRPIQNHIKRLLVLRKVGLGLTTFNSINSFGKILQKVVLGEKELNENSTIKPELINRTPVGSMKCQSLF